MNVCESPSKLKTTDAESLSTFVKLRRSRDWQNEVYTSKQRIISKYSYGDRFIPQRFNSMKLDTNINYVGKTAEQDILHNDFKLNSSYWRQAKFVTNINEIFNIQHSRLLHFGSQTQPEYSLQSRRSCSALKTEDWACLARLRPSAWPDVTNAMPQTSVSYNPNRMDWSTSKQIALSFKENIIVWREGQDITMVFKVNSARALKYSPCGRYLAISCMDMSIPVVELWEVLDEDEFLVSNGKFFKKIYKFISSIEWTHDSKQIVCGTGSGHIIVYSIHDMSTQKILSQHKHKIKRIKLSSAGRYLATSDYKGLIYVFDTNSYNVVAQLDCNVGGLFDWHPWSEPELAIVNRSPAFIQIYNVKRCETVASYKRGDTWICINSINFNKITGELLVNVFRLDEGYCECKIIVLSSLNRVVDVLNSHGKGAIFMMWSPDGKKLCTAGLDESFCIWNFCPGIKLDAKVRQKPESKKQRSSVLELYHAFK